MTHYLSVGCTDNAGPAADPRTDRHVAPGATAEHPHPQRADSEDCRRVWLRNASKGFRYKFLYFFHNTTVSILPGNSDLEALLHCHGATFNF